MDQTLENVALGKSQQPLHIHEHAELHPAAARKKMTMFIVVSLLSTPIIIGVCSHSSALLFFIFFFETGSLSVCLS